MEYHHHHNHLHNIFLVCWMNEWLMKPKSQKTISLIKKKLASCFSVYLYHHGSRDFFFKEFPKKFLIFFWIFFVLIIIDIDDKKEMDRSSHLPIAYWSFLINDQSEWLEWKPWRIVMLIFDGHQQQGETNKQKKNFTCLI